MTASIAGFHNRVSNFQAQFFDPDIGGFVFGAVITLILMRLIPQPPAEDRREMLYDRNPRRRL